MICEKCNEKTDVLIIIKRNPDTTFLVEPLEILYCGKCAYSKVATGNIDDKTIEWFNEYPTFDETIKIDGIMVILEEYD